MYHNVFALHLTPSGVVRRELRNWWIGLGGCSQHSKPDHVALYNSGRNLFVSLLPPGEFIQPPKILGLFRHQLGDWKFGKIEMMHRGHLYGLAGGPATVAVRVQDVAPQWVHVQVAPLQMLHIVAGKLRFECKTALMPLPLSVLEPVSHPLF